MKNTVKTTFEDVLKGIKRVNNIEFVGDFEEIKPEGANVEKDYPYYLVVYGCINDTTITPTQFVFLDTMQSVSIEIRHSLVDSVPVDGIKTSLFLFVYDNIVKGYALCSFFVEKYQIVDEKKLIRNKYFKGSDHPLALLEGVEFYTDESSSLDDTNDIITIPNCFDVITFHYTNIPDGFIEPQNIFEVRRVPDVNELIEFGMWELYLGYTDKFVIRNSLYTITITADADDFDKYIQTTAKNGISEYDIFKEFVNIEVAYTF